MPKTISQPADVAGPAELDRAELPEFSGAFGSENGSGDDDTERDQMYECQRKFQQRGKRSSKRRSAQDNCFLAFVPDSKSKKSPRLAFWTLVVVLWISCWGTAVDAQEPLPVVVLRSQQVTESSGLAFSHRRPDRIWTHNDSGDMARIFAFDLEGNPTAEYRVDGVQAVDWEDMASFTLDGRPRLLVADVGDNLHRRTHVTIYLFDEPDPDASGTIARRQTIRFRYPEGPQDCEAVAVDVRGRQILLATKEFLPIARLYALPLMGHAEAQPNKATKMEERMPPIIEAEYLFRLPMPLMTAMDISPDGERLLLCGYFDLFTYSQADPDDGWRSILQSEPVHQVLPRLRQIEGACFDPQGRVWVSSEGQPGKMVRLPRAGEDG